MSIKNIVMGAAGAAGDSKTYIEDVFSTYLYTGTGNTAQTINNGIDLAGKGGLVWMKSRDNTLNNLLLDTTRGSTKYLLTNSTSGQQDTSGDDNSFSFNANGFSCFSGGYANAGNASGSKHVSWTFRKAPKFFDVVTWTGDGTDNRVLSHSLGIQPGMIIVKRVTGGTENWPVWHRSVSANGSGNLYLNLTNALSGTKIHSADASTFTLTAADTSHNAAGSTYVAYLFAHDTTTDGLIHCGNFSGATTVDVNLGWEPQYVLMKNASDGGSWYVADVMRGMSNTRSYVFQPNTSDAELDIGAAGIIPTATGFTFKGANFGYTSGQNIIYMAIRRGPMRTPTDGTKVFNLISRVGTGANATVTGVGLAPDLCISKCRTGYSTLGSNWQDKLRGAGKFLRSAGTQTEISVTDSITAFGMDGVTLGSDATSGEWNYSSSVTYINWFFKRAPGFFDVVCYTGTGALQNVTHGLGVAPELIINKSRSDDANSGWPVYAAPLGNHKVVRLNYTDSSGTSDGWGNTSPTATQFTVDGYNTSGVTYVAYLFASCPGVSKVGSYTGNGSSQTINCGFTNGARFVLIKRTDEAQYWTVFDTARGITTGVDPYLFLNSTVQENAGGAAIDVIDPHPTGFTLDTDWAALNEAGGSYIYLAIA